MKVNHHGLLLTILTFHLLLSCSYAWGWRNGMTETTFLKTHPHSSGRNTCHLTLRGGEVEKVSTLEGVEEFLTQSTGKLVVIYFTSKDCPPCKTVSPLYEELSECDEFGGPEKVIFLKIDVDDNPETASKYGVTGWPTFLFIKNGEVQTEIVGGKLAEATLYDWVKLLVPKDDVTTKKDD